jgi:hypothetical protein
MPHDARLHAFTSIFRSDSVIWGVMSNDALG